MNAIEKNHYLMKLMLVLARDLRAMQGRVRSVRFIREYAEMPEDIGVYTLSRMEDAEILALAESVGIKKTPSHAKSDIYLNDLGYSFQTFADNPPVVVGGEPRESLVAVCNQLELPIAELDEMIDEYWRLRESGSVGEEVSNSDPLSPFKEHKALLVPILSYFLFTGSAEGPSHFPADCVLDFVDPCNMNTWTLYETDQAMELLWDRFVFSVVPISGSESDDRWTRLVEGQPVGGLYVRVEKQQT